MGSEYYAYFVLESERVSSSELEELAADSGGADLPRTHGSQVVARLSAESRARQGQEAELWFDSSHLQLFDAESGRSLLASNGASQPAAATARPTTS
jgi:multiple sugar transport system ATP-binding protein